MPLKSIVNCKFKISICINFIIIFNMSQLKVDKLNEGEGPICPKGATVWVHYTGKFTNG